VFTEIIGTVVFGVLLLVLWGVHAKPDKYGAGILFDTTSVNHNPTWYAFALASLPGAFNLGRWAWPVIGFVLVYTVVVMLVLSLPAPFHGSDKVLGYGLALAALWYFGGLMWRLKKGTAGVKPVEDLADPAQDR
jgi:hypothetical protein